MKNATLDVKFLNEAGVCPEFFSPTDPIYVALMFSTLLTAMST